MRPSLHTGEKLLTAERRLLEKRAKAKLLGSTEEKLQGMREIVEGDAWLAKRWIPPMVRDNDFEVRFLAAKLIVELERTEAIKDLQVAITNENILTHKKLLQEQLDLLVAFLGK